MRRAPLVALVVALLVSAEARAEDTLAEDTLSVETAPLAFAFRGASLGVRWEPASLGGLALSAGVYGFTLPDAFIMGDNADEGWEVRLLPAFTLGADYYLDESGRGVSFGAALVTTTFRLRSDRVAGDASYQALYVVPRVSYTWFIWRGLYVTPWLGVELHVKLAGEPELGGQRFEPFFINPSPNLNIGYRF